ncbi:MAG: aminopeptidase P family N-terminal domain-containing protein, partial [bacterium]|nr:aminopeptidase P family N-terminal domain-containing protein [bacterium]
MNIFEQRITKLREQMLKANMDAVFLMVSGDLFYMTGLPREPHNQTDDNKHGDEMYGAYFTLDKGPIFVVPR